MIRAEIAKMRRLRTGIIVLVMVVGVTALAVLSALSSPDFSDPGTRSWAALLAGMSLAVPLTSPLLLAVLASRQVDIEHHGNGWLLFQTSGATRGGLCRAKLAVLGAVVCAVTAAEAGLVLLAGIALAVPGPPPLALWWGYAGAVAVVNLVLLGLHILISARVENQLAGLGIGVLGTLLAVFATGLPPLLAHLTPWGYYALATAAGYRDGELVTFVPGYASIAALAVLGGVLFAVFTTRFDRREAS
nr:ABC transporter permease [Sediminivirga luteola]